MSRAFYPPGELPPLGVVPKEMFAQCIRPERYGEPSLAMQVERVPVPTLRPGDVLVMVMAAGINYNGVWSSRGTPIDLVALHAKEGDDCGFHIGGSDATGVVYALGEGVSGVEVGDHVVIHGGVWDEADPFILQGGDPLFSKSTQMWGYEANYGAFAQFARVRARQCAPKAKHLTWEQAAAPSVGGATAVRMLLGWPPHTVEEGDVVLIWGGAGGLGAMAIQIVAQRGGIPVAVVSNQERQDFCMDLGAKGCINRRDFDHWGILPRLDDEAATHAWTKQARAFGRAIWDVVGEKKNPRIVFEHAGEATFPTSLFVCDTGGMVVLCGATSGFYAVADLRYTWTRQKRIQGSHYANDEQFHIFNQMVIDGEINPCLSRLFTFDEIGAAHDLMAQNQHPAGNMAALVSAPVAGLTGLP